MGEHVSNKELEKLSPETQAEEVPNNETTKPADASHSKYGLLLQPVLFGAMLSMDLGQTSIQNFYLRTACLVDLGFPKNVCDSGVGESFHSAEELSQKLVSSVHISRSFVSALVATVVMMFVGPWSDCSGRRKPVILLPLSSMLIMTTAILVMVTFPVLPVSYVIYGAMLPIALGGNFGLLSAAAFSYVGDVCHATGRDVTRTMGHHRAAMQVAHVAGTVTGPLLYRYLGFYGVFPIVLLVQLSSLIYVLLVVKDVNINRSNEVSVFNAKLPYQALRCLLQQREGHKRKIVLILIIVCLADRIVMSAEMMLSYMFYRRKFGWTDVMYGSFSAYKNILSFLGTLFILHVMKKSMKLTDELVGVCSCLAFVVSTLGLVAAQTTAVVFALPVIGLISQGSQVVRRPLINKQISPTEQGKIYSIMAALESAIQMVAAPLYSLLYSRTVTSYPDAWLLPGVAIAGLQTLAYLTTRYYRKKTARETDEEAVRNVPLKELKRENSAR